MNKRCANVLKDTLGLFVISILILVVLMFSVIFILPEQFEDTYTHEIQIKVQTLKDKKEPGVIIVGNSSAAFGIDNEQLSELLDKPVVNLGLQGGMGTEILMNMAAEYCVEGDIVVYAANEGFWTAENGTEESRSFETIATGFDGQPSLYRFVPASEFGDLMVALPAFIFKKVDRFFEGQNKEVATGAYSISSFDDKGNMIIKREEWIYPTYTVDENWICSFQSEKISSTCISQLNRFEELLNDKGASMLVSYGPLLDTCVDGTEEEIQEFQSRLKEELEAPVISKLEDYIYPIDYFYNSPSHCNDIGCDIRTNRLAQDILLYLEGENK